MRVAVLSSDLELTLEERDRPTPGGRRGARTGCGPIGLLVMEAVRAAGVTDGRGVDVIVEASGTPAAVQDAFDAARRGGSVVLAELSPDGEFPLDTNGIIDNELDVFGSLRYRNTYPAAIHLLADGAIDAEGSSTSRSPRRRRLGVPASAASRDGEGDDSPRRRLRTEEGEQAAQMDARTVKRCATHSRRR